MGNYSLLIMINNYFDLKAFFKCICISQISIISLFKKNKNNTIAPTNINASFLK